MGSYCLYIVLGKEHFYPNCVDIFLISEKHLLWVLISTNNVRFFCGEIRKMFIWASCFLEHNIAITWSAARKKTIILKRSIQMKKCPGG